MGVVESVFTASTCGRPASRRRPRRRAYWPRSSQHGVEVRSYSLDEVKVLSPARSLPTKTDARWCAPLMKRRKRPSPRMPPTALASRSATSGVKFARVWTFCCPAAPRSRKESWQLQASRRQSPPREFPVSSQPDERFFSPPLFLLLSPASLSVATPASPVGKCSPTPRVKSAFRHHRIRIRGKLHCGHYEFSQLGEGRWALLRLRLAPHCEPKFFQYRSELHHFKGWIWTSIAKIANLGEKNLSLGRGLRSRTRSSSTTHSTPPLPNSLPDRRRPRPASRN